MTDRIGMGAAAPADGPAARRLRAIYALEDFEPAARRHLPPPMFGYVAGAAETNASAADNRAVFGEIGFLPRAGIDVSERALGCRVMGLDFALAFGILGWSSTIAA